MTATAEVQFQFDQHARAAMLEELRLADVREDAETDPKALINEIRYFDPVTQLWVQFEMFPPDGWEAPLASWPDAGDPIFTTDGAKDWYWQSVIVDWLHDPRMKKYLIYKARQLGMTLLACAYGLWLMLYRPGSNIVAYSYEQEEAKKLVEAAWAMFESLPEVLRNGVEVITPKRGLIPSEWIRLRHPDGRLSTFQALPATKKHGHGSRVTFAIMDEVARMDYARDIYTAINPATSRGSAKLVMISTANGVSNRETGEGNFFHHLYATKREKKLRYVFLPWNLEPTRSQEWYEEEAMKLDDVERNQQYPLNENDGFMLSGALFFKHGLDFYRNNPAPVKFRGQFVLNGRKGRFLHLRDGIIDIFEEPDPSRSYGLSIDPSTGRAEDYTSMDVIDLSTGNVVAHLRAKITTTSAAFQAHFLGKWYNTALIIIDRNGAGEGIITALKDGNRNLKPYPRLYRHKRFTSGKKQIAEEYGYPIGPKSRLTILDGLKTALRQEQFPWLSADTVDELGTFVYKDTQPTPRAEDGCNDDCVFSLALAWELFQQKGEKPDGQGHKPWRPTPYSPPPTRSV